MRKSFECEIPGSLTDVGESVFYDCDGLKNVTIEEGATTVGSEMFSGCSYLQSVTIPNSVTSIGSNAFSGTKFVDVNYRGTEEEWNAIDKYDSVYEYRWNFDADGLGIIYNYIGE